MPQSIPFRGVTSSGIPFVNLPHRVLYSGVSGAAVRTYCALSTYVDDDGRTPCMTRAVLADRMSRSTRSISEHTKELEQAGFIQIIPQYDGRERSGNVYVLLGGNK